MFRYYKCDISVFKNILSNLFYLRKN